MPSCYAVGAKKALIYRAYRTQNRGSKEKIPYPSKSAFYCATNLKQRSDEATKHPKYKYLSDFDKKNAFDMEKHLRRRPAIVKPDEVFDYYEVDEADLQEDTENE